MLFPKMGMRPDANEEEMQDFFNKHVSISNESRSVPIIKRMYVHVLFFFIFVGSHRFSLNVLRLLVFF